MWYYTHTIHSGRLNDVVVYRFLIILQIFICYLNFYPEGTLSFEVIKISHMLIRIIRCHYFKFHQNMSIIFRSAYKGTEHG